MLHADEAVASRWAVDSAECISANFHDIAGIDFNKVLLTDQPYKTSMLNIFQVLNEFFS